METEKKSNEISKDCLLYRDNFLHSSEYSNSFLELVIKTVTKEDVKVKRVTAHWERSEEERGTYPDVDILATNGKTYSIILPQNLDENLAIIVR